MLKFLKICLFLSLVCIANHTLQLDDITTKKSSLQHLPFEELILIVSKIIDESADAREAAAEVRKLLNLSTSFTDLLKVGQVSNTILNMISKKFNMHPLHVARMVSRELFESKKNEIVMQIATKTGGSNITLDSIVIDSNSGKLIVAGYLNHNSIYIARFNKNNALDTDFATKGYSRLTERSEWNIKNGIMTFEGRDHTRIIKNFRLKQLTFSDNTVSVHKLKEKMGFGLLFDFTNGHSEDYMFTFDGDYLGSLNTVTWSINKLREENYPGYL